MFRIYICIIANHFMNLTQKILIDFINFCSRSLVQRTWVEIANGEIIKQLAEVVLLYREHGLKC